MDLLTFLDERVVLSDSSKSELVHEVDLVGLDHVLVLEARRRKEGCQLGELLTREGVVRREGRGGREDEP